MISYRQADFQDFQDDEANKKREEMQAISSRPPILTFQYEDNILKLIEAPGTAWNLDVAQMKEELMKHYGTESGAGAWVRIPRENIKEEIHNIAKRALNILPVQGLKAYFKSDRQTFVIMFNV